MKTCLPGCFVFTQKLDNIFVSLRNNPDTGNVGKAVTDGTQSLTIPVAAGNKQVYISIIGTYSYYLDHIDVAF